MHAVVACIPAGVVPQVVPPVVVDGRAVAPLGGRAVPNVPVEAGRRIAIRSQGKVPLALHVEHAAQVDITELALFDELLRFEVIRGAAVLRADLNDPLVLPSGLDHLLAFPRVVAGRLLDVDVLACLTTEDGQRAVPVVGRGNDDGINRGFLQELSVILDELDLLAALPLAVVFAPGIAGGRVHVADVGNLAVVTFQETAGKAVSSAADSDHAKRHLLVGRGPTHRLAVGQNCESGAQAEGRMTGS